MKVFGTTVISVVFLFLFIDPSTAAIKSIKIQSDNRSVILLGKFGFTHYGNLSISISNLSVSDPVASLYDPSVIGFFLLSDETLIELVFEAQRNPNFWFWDIHLVSYLFTLRDISDPQSSFHKSYSMTFSEEYALFYANCNTRSLVTMDIHTEMYNIDDGATKDYLSAGLTQLPSLYFIFSLMYLSFLGFWISLCFNNQRCVHRVHLLMGVSLTMQTLSLFCAAEDNHYVKVTGTPHGWNVLFWIFQFISSVLLFTLIVLMGAGLPYLKPVLHAREKIVLMIVITFKVLANVASMMMDETGPYNKDWMTWRQVYMWSDTISCSVIILPVGWSIRFLTEPSKTDEKSRRNLTLFVRLFRLVVCYLVFARVGVIALMDITTYKFQWVSSAVEEVACLVLYLVIYISVVFISSRHREALQYHHF
ncbi:putative transmembrane protein GPR107/GPR108 [Helianthus debilis subsp. tardiflorus]